MKEKEKKKTVVLSMLGYRGLLYLKFRAGQEKTEDLDFSNVIFWSVEHIKKLEKKLKDKEYVKEERK